MSSSASSLLVKEKADSSSNSSNSSGIKNDMEANRVNLFLHAENVRIFCAPQDRCLPVTLVTGFLGAGKTTLLNHILSNKSNLRIAAAINDFGELNIDENLIRHQGTANRVVELSNGCICCSHLLDDLQTAVWNILQAGGDVDVDAINYLVIETSGVSNPLSIIRTLDAKFGKCFRARLDSVVTVVDADQMLPYCSSTSSTSTSDAGSNDDNNDVNVSNGKRKSSMSQAAIAQLECADVVIVNKMDLLLLHQMNDDDNPVKAVERLIRSINPHARIHQTRHCQIPLAAILDVQTIPCGTGTEKTTPITHEQSSVPIYVSATGGALRCSSSLDKSNGTTTSTMTASSAHLKTDTFVSLSVTVQNGPLSLRKFCQFVTSPMVIDRLARIKGVLWIQSLQLESYRCVVHLSGRGRLGFQLDGKWTGPPVSQMAFIGQSSNFAASEIETAFSNCSRVLPCDTNDKKKKRKEEEENAANGCNEAWHILKQSPEFDLVVLDDSINDGNDDNENLPLLSFRLTGSRVYGFSIEEMERDLRIDIDAMNMDLADAVNASIDRPKAFVVYTKARIKSNNSSSSSRTCAHAEERVVLCYPAGIHEPANNWQVLLREARVILQTHFRNVQVCKCGA